MDESIERGERRVERGKVSTIPERESRHLTDELRRRAVRVDTMDLSCPRIGHVVLNTTHRFQKSE